MLTSFAQRQNRSFHSMESVRMAAKCMKIKYGRAKCAKLLFLIVKCTKLWRSRLPSSSCMLKLSIIRMFLWKGIEMQSLFCTVRGYAVIDSVCFSLAGKFGDKLMGQSLPTTKNNKNKLMRDFFDAILWNCSVLSDPSQGGTVFFFGFISCALLIKQLVPWNALRSGS